MQWKGQWKVYYDSLVLNLLDLGLHEKYFITKVAKINMKNEGRIYLIKGHILISQIPDSWIDAMWKEVMRLSCWQMKLNKHGWNEGFIGQGGYLNAKLQKEERVIK